MLSAALFSIFLLKIILLLLERLKPFFSNQRHLLCHLDVRPRDSFTSPSLWK